jgi:N6-L-threonylcarbamoyladenine synthase
MIAVAALRSYYAGLFADLSLDAAPNAKLGTWTCDLAPTIS